MEFQEWLKTAMGFGGGGVITLVAWLLYKGEFVPRKTHEAGINDLKEQLKAERENSKKWEDRTIIAWDQSRKLYQLTEKALQNVESKS